MHNVDFPGPRRILYLGIIWVFGAVVLSYPFLFPPKELDPFDEQNIAPYVEQKMPNFAKIQSITERKKAFFDYLLPAIHHHNKVIIQKRDFLNEIKNAIEQQLPFSYLQQKRLDSLVKEYRVDPDDDLNSIVDRLMRRIDIIPVELVLMQAANESAWGTSRFAQKGYNFFGLWCFRKGCGFVPKRRNEDAAHEVAKFKSLDHAVSTYFRNLNRHDAYKELRAIRLSLRENDKQITAEKLAKGLKSYSQRGDEYIEELINMIRFNRKFLPV
ncbi:MULTISPECIES: glucosaminidase domain-containing protein [Alteromonadaceae]|uniref:glucosaminidase domain-containing protein n=1 Tax=Alteromonadaceae TaxID=72275 RepID=UPI001C082249|nr:MULTISPECIES: glucosaminidase domain-containing protein [Aliiglaciecola]MBU2876361.1 glucosaminidase domain-containing protein [Aliiglaciecola lipolytica]MDO6710577.1 glucosaminidase domain-containing protein [Aliiglaciecola sp. 2_MG-2023]MDO6751558.1 glucosaminidase domain-containing protein [Aliiglaciecola sp. 1_MG-2023]